MRMSFLIATAAIAAVGASTAQAAITVIGSTTARMCYEAAEYKRNDASSLKICDEALQERALTSKDKAATFVNRGIIKMRRREFVSALEDYESALELNGRLGEAHTNRGIAIWYSQTGNEDALAALTRGIELKTGDLEVAYYMRAAVNEALGNVEAAYRDYQQAIQISPRWLPPQKELERFKVVSSG
ncbi:MAG: hypothetical protein WA979_10820 [Pacificimonas sp.]